MQDPKKKCLVEEKRVGSNPVGGRSLGHALLKKKTFNRRNPRPIGLGGERNNIEVWPGSWSHPSMVEPWSWLHPLMVGM